MEVLDLLIIGGGPIGINCGIIAQKNHLSFLIIEKGTIANSIYHYPLYMTFFSTSEKLEIAGVPFITTTKKPGRQDALEYYQGIARHQQLNIHLYERVISLNKEDCIFTVTTDKSIYYSKNVIISTGFYDIPNKLNVPGEDLPKVKHYYKEPYPFVNQKVAVVGASNSAVDAALECYRKGAEVTMIVRGTTIGDRVKYWVKPDIENRIKEGSIYAYFDSEIIEITEDSVIFKDGTKKTHQIENDFVLAMTGYLPDFQLLMKAGVNLLSDKKNPQYDPETMETNVKGLYLAGVVCGGLDTHLWFIENSRIHSEVIVKHILKGNNLS